MSYLCLAKHIILPPSNDKIFPIKQKLPRLRVGFAGGTFVAFIIIYLDEKKGDFEKCCQPFTFGAKKNGFFMLY